MRPWAGQWKAKEEGGELRWWWWLWQEVLFISGNVTKIFLSISLLFFLRQTRKNNFHILPIISKFSDKIFPPKKVLGSGRKIKVGRVTGNKTLFLCLRLSTLQHYGHTIHHSRWALRQAFLKWVFVSYLRTNGKNISGVGPKAAVKAIFPTLCKPSLLSDV